MTIIKGSISIITGAICDSCFVKSVSSNLFIFLRNQHPSFLKINFDDSVCVQNDFSKFRFVIRNAIGILVAAAGVRNFNATISMIELLGHENV